MKSANLQSHLLERNGVCQPAEPSLGRRWSLSTTHPFLRRKWSLLHLQSNVLYLLLSLFTRNRKNISFSIHVTFVSIYYISLELASKLLLATKRAPIQEMWILIGQYLIEDNLHWFSNGMVCKKNSHLWRKVVRLSKM
jgi:hypothetical protein